MNHKKKIINTIIGKIPFYLDTRVFTYGWLLLLCILCFGILIPKLGFYWDDLPYLYQYAAFGPQGFAEFVASDRPFSGWIFSTTTFLFGFNPLGYHLLALVLRWICTILVYEIIRSIWAEKKRPFLITAASIFAIYPGFLQQPIALIYVHHISVFMFFLLSIYLMIQSKMQPEYRTVFSIISILLTFGMFSIENFATLEIIRPFILWKISKQQDPKVKNKLRFTSIVRSWAPYLVIFLFFIYWRVVVFEFPTYQPTFLTILNENPFIAVKSLITRIPKDFFTVTVGAWIRSFKFPVISEFGSSATLLLWVLMGFSFIVSFIVSQFLNRNENRFAKNQKPVEFTMEIFFSGLVLFLLSGSIVWVLDLSLEIEFAWDRMTIAFIPATAIIGGGLITIFNKTRVIQSILFAILISFGVGSHFENGMAYKRDWETLHDFIWQVSWRIPALAENSILIGSEVGLKYYSDNSLSAPINLMFAKPKDSNQLTHFVYYTEARSDAWFEKELENKSIKKTYRSFQFNGNSSDVIAFTFEPPGCMKILDRTYSNSITNPNLSFRQVKEIAFSNIDLIIPNPAHTPDLRLFAEKSTTDWCYFFEQADLARQYQEFSRIEELGNKALELDLSPRVASEWLPFLEGYIWQENWERTKWIIEEVQSAEGNFTNGVCYTLNRIQRSPDFPNKNDLSKIILSYNCN